MANTNEPLRDLYEEVRALFDIQDRKHGFPGKSYPKCFVGQEAVHALIQGGLAADEQYAVRLGNVLLNAGLFHHVLHEHEFKNEYLFYRFAEDEDHGKAAKKGDGKSVSWADFLAPMRSSQSDSVSLQAKLPERDADFGGFVQDDLSAMGVSPLDEHNIKLLDNTHPKEWEDPDPKDRYNLVVIGGGTGGLVSASAGAGVGARTAMIEAHMLGGDCLNVGCVPSKALLSAAKAVANVRKAANYGVHVNGEITVDFPAVMERMRRLRAGIAPHDSATRYATDLGVDVFMGKGKFTGPNTVEVNGKELKFAKAVIATGATAAVPPIPGLQDVPYLTNASVFNLTELPPRMAVIGAGPIGLELAQAFQRFGSDVSVFLRGSQLLPKEDPDAAEIVAQSLTEDGVAFETNVAFQRVEQSADGTINVVVEQDGNEKTFTFDALLVATGRKPNVSGLGLENVGVEFDARQGVTVDDQLRTTNPNIFAVGDVATRYQFTHMADFMARIIIRNALFFGRDKVSNLLVPWATYTDPEVAHVGLYEKDLRERGIEFDTITRHFADVDRAIVDGATKGFVKIHVKKGSDEIVGATIVGSHAGDMISEITVAMQAGMGLGSLANVIHPYPTAAEAVRQCGDAYNRTRLTPTVKKIFNRVMALQR